MSLPTAKHAIPTCNEAMSLAGSEVIPIPLSGEMQTALATHSVTVSGTVKSTTPSPEDVVLTRLQIHVSGNLDRLFDWLEEEPNIVMALSGSQV